MNITSSHLTTLKVLLTFNIHKGIACQIALFLIQLYVKLNYYLLKHLEFDFQLFTEDAVKVFSNSIAIVIGPTPPGRCNTR